MPTFGIPEAIPLKYLGPEAGIIPIMAFPRRPLTTDRKYPVGQFVILKKNPSTGIEGELWYLSNFDSSGDPVWIQFQSSSSVGAVFFLETDDGAPAVGPDGTGTIIVGGGTGIITSGQDPATTVTIAVDTSVVTTQYDADAGSATPTAGVIILAGGTGITTSAAGNTVTFTAAASIPLTFAGDAGTATPALNTITIAGGTGCSTSAAAATLTVNLDAAVPLTFTSDAGIATPAVNNLNIVGGAGIATSGAGSTITVTALAPTTLTFNGDAGSATPVADTITIAGGTLCSTSAAAATVTVNVDSTVASTFTSDAGIATAAVNNLNVLGGTGCSTTGAGSTITVNVDASVPLTFNADAGSATPALNAISIVGGTNVNTSGAGSTITINAAGTSFSVQQKRTSTTSLFSAATTMASLTIPQNTDGTEIITVTITPTNAANILVIEANVMAGIYNGANDNYSAVCGAIFQDATVNAIAATLLNQHKPSSGAGADWASGSSSNLTYYMAAGTTSATTFKLRVGMVGGSNWAVNGRLNGAVWAQAFNGVGRTSLIVTEYTS